MAESDDEMSAEAAGDVPAPDGPVVAEGVADAVVSIAPDGGFAEAVSGGLTWIPFALYMGLWLVLSGLTAYFLNGASVEHPARWMPIYVPLLWSGVGLTAFGPLLSLIVWVIARARRQPSARAGLLTSSMIRGSLIAFFGMAMWLATLFILEIIATGGSL